MVSLVSLIVLFNVDIKVNEAGITLTYRNPFAKWVALRWNYDNWTKLWMFVKKKELGTWKGKWILRISPKGIEPTSQTIIVPYIRKGIYKFYLVVDGIALRKTTHTIKVSQDIFISRQYPIKIPWKKYTYEFKYIQHGVKNVYLVGSFNGFNPYSLPLTKIDDKTWTITLTLLPGSYIYAFIVDGEWVPDPMNPNLRIFNNIKFSYLNVPKEEEE